MHLEVEHCCILYFIIWKEYFLENQFSYKPSFFGMDQAPPNWFFDFIGQWILIIDKCIQLKKKKSWHLDAFIFRKLL